MERVDGGRGVTGYDIGTLEGRMLVVRPSTKPGKMLASDVERKSSAKLEAAHKSTTTTVRRRPIAVGDMAARSSSDSK